MPNSFEANIEATLLNRKWLNISTSRLIMIALTQKGRNAHDLVEPILVTVNPSKVLTTLSLCI